MAERNRSGFTLVELLVVVVIIAILIGLLLPAVIGARERARQTQCSNNQHELALAVVQYETAKGHLPGYRNSFGPINRGNPGAAPLSWAVVLLPYLGNEDLWQRWRVGNPEIVDLPVLTCPSDATDQQGLSYAANCGLIDPLVDPNNPPAPSSYLDRAAYGLFHDRFYFDVPEVRSERIPDGASQTLLFAENIQAGNWPDMTEARIGTVWVGYQNVPPPPGACGNPNQLPVAVNDCRDAIPGAPPDDIIYARPSSRHTGGVLVTYCDGRQVFLNDEDMVDYNVYRVQMIPDDAAARTAGLIP